MEPIITLSDVEYTYPGEVEPVFTGLNIALPPGITSVIGQNGTGKSTLLLLAGGRLFPQKGVVEILGRDTRDLSDEAERNEYASFIYQNMEFEADETVGELMEYILENGFREERTGGFIDELAAVFELSEARGSQLQKLSKGEMQRTILAFSLLYGSKIIMMDEPLFALEDRQKHRAMEYTTQYARDNSVHLLYSVHELELTQKYSDNVALFYKDGSISMGETSQVLIDENIENAYELPRAMLYQKEHLYRENLLRLSAIHPEPKIGEN